MSLSPKPTIGLDCTYTSSATAMRSWWMFATVCSRHRNMWSDTMMPIIDPWSLPSAIGRFSAFSTNRRNQCFLDLAASSRHRMQGRSRWWNTLVWLPIVYNYRSTLASTTSSMSKFSNPFRALYLWGVWPLVPTANYMGHATIGSPAHNDRRHPAELALGELIICRKTGRHDPENIIEFVRKVPDVILDVILVS